MTGAARAQRVWLGALQLVLVLPFVTVTDCSSSKVTEYTGIEFYFSADRWGLLAALAVCTGLLLAFPWGGSRTPRDGVAMGMRAVVATVGALVATVGPAFAFLFDNPQPKVGWILHALGWVCTYGGYLVFAFVLLLEGRRSDPKDLSVRGDAERMAAIAVAIGPMIGAALRQLTQAVDLADLAIGVLVGEVVLAPVVLTGFALRRALRTDTPVGALRGLWWALATVTFAASLAAGIVEG